MSQVNNIQPAMTFLNMTGDITISWDDANKDTMLAMVQGKMKEGYTFFVLQPRFLKFLGKKKVRVDSVDQLAGANAVVVDDETYAKMMGRLKLHDKAVESAVASGAAYLTTSDVPVNRNMVRRATSADDVVQNQTIAVRQIVGG